ncbi:hypothetical protein NDU88_007022 [Pleurodeles waltl]|uniref:Uncharacterized protein n=1 Tax=Pleurodeles waltl TaxID=8319 RepID=A0AAV7U1T4_PLEWA|nr:hypothetical protein NDU88_007022 [Pleurodeles waltl]
MVTLQNVPSTAALAAASMPTDIPTVGTAKVGNSDDSALLNKLFDQILALNYQLGEQLPKKPKAKIRKGDYVERFELTIVKPTLEDPKDPKEYTHIEAKG